MSGSIDELSKTLGVISSDIKHLVNKTANIDDKVETLQNHSVEHKASTKAAHKRIDDIAPKVTEHENLKNKGIGILAVISIVFGILGNAISKVIQSGFQ